MATGHMVGHTNVCYRSRDAENIHTDNRSIKREGSTKYMNMAKEREGRTEDMNMANEREGWTEDYTV